jgi:iron complex outermembrane recepter protein
MSIHDLVPHRRSLVCLVGWFLLLAGTGGWAQAPSRQVDFDIPAQAMSTALVQFGKQAGMQVVSSGQDLGGIFARAVRGRLTAREAIDRLLEGTQLVASFNGVDTLVIKMDERGKGRPSAAVAPASERAEADRDVHKAESIMVTATKREERLQDVPLSVAVIGSQDIDRRGLRGMEDYLRSIPGVNQVDIGASGNAIVIRGITTSPQNENTSTGAGATVSSYFGETPITAAAGLGGGQIDLRPVDLERIEVLRGPQGTTFGASSLSGTVRLIPAKPRLDEFGARVVTSFSDTARNGSVNSMMQAVLNMPIIQDKFAVRLVGYRYDDSGFYKNVAGENPGIITSFNNVGLADLVRGFVQEDRGRMRTVGGRLAALWEVSSKLNLSMNLLTQRIEQDGFPVAHIGTYEQLTIPVAPIARLRGQVGEAADAKMDLANVDLNYDLGWAGLTSTSSWINSGSQRAIAPAITGLPASDTAKSDFKSLTTEARVASKLKGRFQFLAGVFYERVEEDYVETADWPVAQAPASVRSDPLLGNVVISRDRTQTAGFGEASYLVTDKLTATVGGRYRKYDKDQSDLREGRFFFNIPIGAGIPAVLQNSETGQSYKGILSYKAGQDSLLYTSVAQGFRLGRPAAGITSLCDANNDGLIDGTSVTVASTRIIDSDTLDNYEVGGKFTLFDRRLSLDTSIYHIKWDGLPTRVNAPVTATCNGLPYIANAGKATSDGAEFQASLRVAKGLRLDFGFGYMKAVLAEDAPALRVSKGARLPGSPKANANLSVQYDFLFGGRNAFVRADSFYTGKFYGDLLSSPLTEAGGYFKIDLRGGVRIENVAVELFVQNLTNEDSFTWRGLANGNSSFGYRLRPRTIGVQIGYRFG